MYKYQGCNMNLEVEKSSYNGTSINSETNYEPHILKDSSQPYIFHFGNVDAIPHWHENIELLYFYKKSKVICAREEHYVDEGDVAVFASNALHSVQSLGGFHDCLIVDSSFLKKNDIDISDLKFETVIRSQAISERFLTVAEEIRRLSAYDGFGAAAVKASILSLMVELCRGFSHVGDDAEGCSEVVKRAIGYINAHYGRYLTINQIAESVNVSKYYFCRKFHKETGYTVIQYINNLRCREAEKLLIKGKCSVGEAARLCGFENLSYFTRTYKTIIGHTPTKSKETLKNN